MPVKPPSSNTTVAANHIDFFDPVRVLTMLCVILYHSVTAYSTTTPQFPIHDADPIAFADYVRWLFDPFMMPMFFFMAGFFAMPSLTNKTPGAFVYDKIRRIGVPWLAVMVSFAGLLLFGARFKTAFQHQEIISFGDILTEMIQGFLYIGAPRIGGQLHLWFMSLLLFFFLVFAIVWKVAGLWGKQTRNRTSGPNSVENIPLRLLLFGAGIGAAYYVVVHFFPRINDFLQVSLLSFEPTKIIANGGFFGLGVYAYCRGWLAENKALGSVAFWLSLLVASLLTFLVSGNDILVARSIPHGFPELQLLIFAAARSFLCLSVVMLMLSVARRYWRSPSILIRRISDNSFHIYIIHLFIVLGCQGALLNWPGGSTWEKLLIVFLLAFGISYIISRFVTRKFPKTTLAALLLVCVISIHFLNPHRYEKAFDQRQLAMLSVAVDRQIPFEELKQKGLADFREADEQPREYLPNAFETLSVAHMCRQDDTEIMSCLGRATVHIAVADLLDNPLEFQVYYAKGFHWLDESVHRDPRNLTVRLNRALAAVSVPEWINRKQCAMSDFEYLAQVIDQNPAIDRSLQKTVFTHLILLYDSNHNHLKSNDYKIKLKKLTDRPLSDAANV
jgi:hypothetical protein